MSTTITTSATLTQRVDGALAGQLHFFQERPLTAIERAQGRTSTGGPRDPSAATTLWIVYPDGQVQASPGGPALPALRRRSGAARSTRPRARSAR